MFADFVVITIKVKNLSVAQIKKSFKQKGHVTLDNIPDECYDEIKSVISNLENQNKIAPQVM